MSRSTTAGTGAVVERHGFDALREHHPWEWASSLASAEPGRRYRVSGASFSLVRQRCRELGCVQGAEVTCLSNGPLGVTLAMDNGEQVFLERLYAWFVHADEA